MGMQAHFNKSELPKGAVIVHGPEDDAVIRVGHVRVQAYNPERGEHFWFDCGSASDQQMHQLKTLISWRTPFICS